MNESVLKYPLPLKDRTSVWLPVGATILSIQEQHGQVCLWARVDPAAPQELRMFRVAGTGHVLGPCVGKHVGTVMLDGGRLVLHIFEVTS